MTQCPSSEELGQWLADGLAGAEGADVEAHVETCVTCQQALERLTDDVALRKDRGTPAPGESGGDFLLRLERAPPTPTAPGEPEVDFLLLQRYPDLTVHLLRRFRLSGLGRFRARTTTGLFCLDRRAARLRLW